MIPTRISWKIILRMNSSQVKDGMKVYFIADKNDNKGLIKLAYF